jgi:acyl-CoA thioester hydrolase
MTIALQEIQEHKTLKSPIFRTQIRVIYADTDKMGVVYHAKYLEYFEIGRNELLREIGFPYKYLEERGVFLPLIECHLNYLRPAQYDDLIEVHTCITQDPYKFLRFKIYCEVYQGEKLLAKGYTIHVTSNSEGRPAKPPKDVHQVLFEAMFGKEGHLKRFDK